MSEQKLLSASIEAGRSDARGNVLIFHGYSSSPDEFRLLADVLAKRLDAYVRVPLMPGHGSSDERDILPVRFKDYVRFALEAAHEMARDGKPLAIIGHSFGGYLALLAAAEVEASAVVLTVIPYSLPFPLWIPGIEVYARRKRFWDKHLSKEELKQREGFFFYPHMPGKALSYVKKGNNRINRILHTITCPILALHNSKDFIAGRDSGARILQMSGGNPLNRSLVFDYESHGIYYGPHRDEVISTITDFLQQAIQK